MGFVESLGAFLVPLYRWAMNWDRQNRKRFRLPVPVLSVGNIAMGGRAKTPTVAWICQFLRSEGFQPVVLMRGYKRKSRQALWLSLRENQLYIYDPTLKKEEILSADLVPYCGDEAVELTLLTSSKVLVGAKRAQNALSFIASDTFDSNRLVFVLDDGFQHWSLERDYDLVLVKKEDLVGQLFPRGHLREGPESLERADRVLELEKDVFKKLEIPASWKFSSQACVLTTRAASSDLAIEFSERWPEIKWSSLHLKDHAPKEKMMAALKEIPIETDIVLGLKEAVKLIAPQELRDPQKSIFKLETGHRAYLLRLELVFEDIDSLKKEILEKVSKQI
jgi:tetraacyldisaccharide 4'-kinase